MLDQGGRKTTVVSNVEGQVWVKSSRLSEQRGRPARRGAIQHHSRGRATVCSQRRTPHGLDAIALRSPEHRQQ